MRTDQDCALLALGANLTSTIGSPLETLKAAVRALEKRGAVIRKMSLFYSTPAFPAGNGPDYVNAAAEICADWDADETLAHLHAVETEMGRERIERWGQRTLDLDLLAMGGMVLPDPETQGKWRDLPLDVQLAQTPDQLILPHPRMHERAFVLVPLADVAPNWMHPTLKLTVRQLRDALDPGDLAAVKALQ